MDLDILSEIRKTRRAGLVLRVVGSRNRPLNMRRLFPAIRRIRYCGSMYDDEKRILLSKTDCLVFPVRWEEPFGPAITEALASGCYVTGTPYGALPEIVAPQVPVSGTNAKDLAIAVENPQQFDPQTCRNREPHGGFSLPDVNELPPATRADSVAKQLLPWTN